MSGAEKRSIFDMEPDEASHAALDAAAEDEIDAGKGIPHDRVRQWLDKRVHGEWVPPPKA